ncbi:MAG: 2-hydroxyacid dehydrogenase [Candidatus Eremiobacteraeota bacterium]|nr:2-hydroxyacid dehydrogenase [Candidatus Eremiobacteraeota bacterium]
MIPIYLASDCTPVLPGLLAQEFEVVREPGPWIRGMVTSGSLGASAQVMEQLPDLEIIANFGVGVDRVDLEAARARGLVVANTPDVLTESVAELALGLLLSAARRLPAAERTLRSGGWSVPSLGTQIYGKSCGLVGMGRIGSAIARRAEAFGMEIAYFARHPREVGYRYIPDLLELARQSDFLVLIVPGGPETDGLVTAEVLEALGPTGILINVARGSVVDEAALVSALVEGRLGGAGLDVFAREPEVPRELLALDQVVLTPHIGSATQEARRAMAELCVANLRSFFTTGKARTPF